MVWEGVDCVVGGAGDALVRGGVEVFARVAKHDRGERGGGGGGNGRWGGGGGGSGEGGRDGGGGRCSILAGGSVRVREVWVLAGEAG